MPVPMRILSRLTYADVMATVAMFLALGGTSYAAVKLSANSVTSPTIADGSVATRDLADGAVTSAKVRDGSLSARDFAAGTLTAGPRGPQGRPGAGAKGDKGDKGDPGSSAGSASVTRILKGTVTSGGTEVVFDDATFTQRAGEFLFMAGIRFKATAKDFICTGSSPHAGSVGVQLQLDGRGIGASNVNYFMETFEPGQVDLVEQAQWQAAAYAPAVDTPRTASARIYASCQPGGAAFPGVSDVEVVLASVR